MTYAFSCTPQRFQGEPEWTGCRVTISSGNATADVEITTATSTNSFTLLPGEVYIEEDLELEYQTTDGIEDLGLVITSNNYLHIIMENTDLWRVPVAFFDSTQIFPLPDMAGAYEYFMASWQNPAGGCETNHNSQFFTIASPYETSIQIY